MKPDVRPQRVLVRRTNGRSAVARTHPPSVQRFPGSLSHVRGKKTPTPLMKHITEQIGVRRGYTVMAFIVAWEIARSSYPEGMSVEDYADWWKISNATAYRDQQWFRAALPDELTPDRLLDEAKARKIAIQRLAWP